jgi:hypothetical protein
MAPRGQEENAGCLWKSLGYSVETLYITPLLRINSSRLAGRMLNLRFIELVLKMAANYMSPLQLRCS